MTRRAYVMAIRRSDTLTMPVGEQRADALIAAVPAWPGRRSQRAPGARPAGVPLRAGPGATRLETRSRVLAAGPPPSRNPEEISYYACCGSRCSSTASLAWAAGSRRRLILACAHAGFHHPHSVSGLLNSDRYRNKC
jgi:hypothetical protein